MVLSCQTPLPGGNHQTAAALYLQTIGLFLLRQASYNIAWNLTCGIKNYEMRWNESRGSAQPAGFDANRPSPTASHHRCLQVADAEMAVRANPSRLTRC